MIIQLSSTISPDQKESIVSLMSSLGYNAGYQYFERDGEQKLMVFDS